MATKPVKRGLKGASAAPEGDVVTIPTARFLELLAAETALANRQRRTHYPRSVIDLNPEMVAFIVERLGRMRLAQILAEVRQVFGPKAPSKSAFDRFMRRYEAGKVGFLPTSWPATNVSPPPRATAARPPAEGLPPRQFRQIPDNPDK